MRRVVFSGILAGLVLFVWSFIAHDLLPFGAAGLRLMTPAQEDSVVAAMHGVLNEQALYLFPSPDPAGDWKTRYSTGPSGVIAFDPHPAARVSADRFFQTILATELLCDLLAGLLAAVIVRRLPARLGLARRALLASLLGLIMTIDVDFSYWNWYGFPLSYTLAQLADHGVGYGLAGFLLARLVGE